MISLSIGGQIARVFPGCSETGDVRRTACLLILTTCLLSSAWGQNAAGIKAANIKGADLALMDRHDPAVELAHFDLLPGYEANLFAAEPMLANPIHLGWDSRGRLWAACSWAYPQLKPGDEANDKIIILEDTDGDGVADTSTVFADGLYMPTGIELANGGCFVAQTPDVFFLKDTDGDDVADVRELALTGFGIEDSHHSISAWRRGPGGWIYFQEGIFLHSQIETQYGMIRNYNGGVYQFNPRTQELRMFAKIGVGNPWGHVFDRWGQSFFVDNPRVSYLTPATGNSGQKIPLPRLIQTEKQCGGDIASGTHLGEELAGQLLTCRFKSRTIIRYEFAGKGAGYTAKVLPPLMASRHPNFRPVDCKVGPDGAVYVADWYNSIINHAQHDFRDPRRDHSHGRIWRITASDRPLVEKPKLVGAPLPELVRQLGSPNHWTRHQARKELSERDGDAVLAALETWLETIPPATSGEPAEATGEDSLPHHLVEALWACQNVERVSEPILERVLTAADGRARAAGARVLRYWHEELADPIDLIARAADDPHPRCRMEAILSAGFIPRAEALPAALRALDHPRDEFIDIALPQTVSALESLWVPALEAGTLPFAKPAHRLYAEQSAGIGFEKRLATFLTRPRPHAEDIEQVKQQLASAGTASQLKLVAGALQRGKVKSRAAKLALLDALNLRGRHVEVNLSRAIGGLRKDLLGADEDIAALVAANVGTWKVTRAAKDLAGVLGDPKRGADLRRAAARGLAQVGGEQELLGFASDGDPETRAHALAGLVRTDLVAASGVAKELLGSNLPDPVGLVREFAARKGGTTALGIVLRDVTIHPAVAEKMSTYQRESGYFPPKLMRYFQAAGSAAKRSTGLRREDRDQLVAAVLASGDPHRGQKIFQRKELACTSCHAIGPGPEIGPNLVAVGAASTPAYLVESILEPNSAIAEHYENQLFLLSDGSVRMGVITFKSEHKIIIRDTARAGEPTVIPVADLQRATPLPSLMPAGLADQLKSRQEFLDLVNFLCQLGRPGPFKFDGAASLPEPDASPR